MVHIADVMTRFLNVGEVLEHCGIAGYRAVQDVARRDQGGVTAHRVRGAVAEAPLSLGMEGCETSKAQNEQERNAER